MRKYDELGKSRRAASDLLSWSLGGKPHHGNDYDRTGYEAPKNPAKPPRSAAEIALETRGRVRLRALNALRAMLVWWLSFDDKERKENN